MPAVNAFVVSCNFTFYVYVGRGDILLVHTESITLILRFNGFVATI